MTEFDKVIHPGGVGKITASIHTTNFKGPITKSVTVTTNDPSATSKTVLQVKADIHVPIDVQPSESVQFDGRYDALVPAHLKVVATDGTPFDVTSMEIQPPEQAALFKAVIAPAGEDGAAPKASTATSASGAKAYDVTVTPSKDVPIGHPAATLMLKTSNVKMPEIPIHIYGTILGDVLVTPEQVVLELSTGAPEAQKTGHIAVSKKTAPPLKILGIDSSDPKLKTKLTTVKAGSDYTIDVTYDGAPAAGMTNAQMTIRTNDKRQGKIPVQVFVRGDQPNQTLTPQIIPMPAPTH